MDPWKQVPIGAIATFNYGKALPASKRIVGSIPVYGSNGIVGWHDQATASASAGIVVGRKGTAGAIHFSSGPFCAIDTTYYITQRDTTANLRFLRYLLQHAKLSRLVSDVVPGLNRDVAYAQIVGVPATLAEQHRIALVLSAAEGAINRQERLIALTTELKRAVTQKLFTEGARGEQIKQTAIGPVPKSWTLQVLSDVSTLIVDCPHSTPKFTRTGVRVVRNYNIRDGEFAAEPAFFTSEADYAERVKRAIPEPGDVLFSREAPVGEACVIPPAMKTSLGQRVMLIRTDPNRLDARFLVASFYAPNIRTRMAATASGLTTPHLNVADVRNLVIPMPNLSDQGSIAEAFSHIHLRLATLRALKTNSRNLFRALLHQLMTAQVRVYGLDLSALDESQAMPAEV
jgi:type I restriction enzyme, S subunit